MLGVKTCRKCYIEKPYTEFHKGKRNPDGYQPYCKPCGYKIRNKSSKKQWNKWGSGVYGIFENGECLYIGESSTLYRRLIQHKTGINNPKNYKFHTNLYKKLQTHNYLIFGIIEETDNHVEREKFYIDMYKPVYNNI